MKDYQELFEAMLEKQYFSPRELQYDTKTATFLSPYEYGQFLNFVDQKLDDESICVKFDLKSFNNHQLRFFISNNLLTLMSNYLDVVIQDNEQTKSFLSLRNADEIVRSRIYSELEGSLNIESVPTTRKAMEELGSGKRDPKSLNDQIIVNMLNGVTYVNKCPEFNKNNLFELYNILSKGCLDEEDKLLPGNLYRHDQVEVGGYQGCPVSLIDECMDSLFSFINENLNNSKLKYLLPHVAHYYIAYVHPYFDYNGRTARMVSYWVSLLTNSKVLPPIISEAINQTKSKYYEALSQTRDSHNDLTYFLLYIYDVSIKYFLTYKNVEEISDILKNKAILLSDLEKNYIKKILISNKGKFTHQDFTNWINVEMTKQGALKILNYFVECGVLNVIENGSKKKLYELNYSVIKYKTN